MAAAVEMEREVAVRVAAARVVVVRAVVTVVAARVDSTASPSWNSGWRRFPHSKFSWHHCWLG